MSIELKNSIVRVLKADGTTSGTGFIIAGEDLIATCAHVVQSAGLGPSDKVTICFLASGQQRHGEVVAEWWRPPHAEDVAILRLGESDLPTEAKNDSVDGKNEHIEAAKSQSLLLGSSDSTIDHSFRTFGFPDVNPNEGIWADGHILGEISFEGVQVLQLSSPQVTPGFSGAPVLDTITHRVVGMVTSILTPDRYGRLAETALITPTKTLWATCPALRPSDVCPYRSLDIFTKDDAEFFYGRQQIVDKLLERLKREPRFLAVLGPSGSGKSSLIQAGLVYQLRQGKVDGSERWGAIITRPADEPFVQLAEQGLIGAADNLVEAANAWMRRHPEQARLVLILDQFEELLVACSDSMRRTFAIQLIRLLESPLSITVILGMRDEFYGRLAQQTPNLIGWLERNTINIPTTLGPKELAAIVREPARAVGLRFDDGLAEAIVDDAIESALVSNIDERLARSTVLPLLEFALKQLWERREEGQLTHKAYITIGGVVGGLTQWADRTYYALGDSQRPLARHLLTRLVHLGDEKQGIPDSRRRMSLDALCQPESERGAIYQVVRRLVDARLLVTSRDIQGRQETVELIHDRLLTGWRRLQQWLHEDRDFLLWYQEIENRAQAWIASGLDGTTE